MHVTSESERVDKVAAYKRPHPVVQLHPQIRVAIGGQQSDELGNDASRDRVVVRRPCVRETCSSNASVSRRCAGASAGAGAGAVALQWRAFAVRLLTDRATSTVCKGGA